MIRENIEIINKLGLHARAAAKLVGVASQFASQIKIETKGRQADAKSIMAVMMLAAAKGSQLTFEISGTDKEKAWNSIQELINNRFDEGE